VLIGEPATRVRDVIREICGDHDVKIMKGHVSKDHG
jgi:REP element-mobilizing transposase RayT